MAKVMLTLTGFLILVSFQGNISSPERKTVIGPSGAFWFQQKDTCMIEGLVFEFYSDGEINGLKAIIRNGRIRVVSSKQETINYRVIRYVFSIRRDEKYSSVRHYGDLVSYPVIKLLESAEAGDIFYFEDIIIADPLREILQNAVKPIMMKRL